MNVVLGSSPGQLLLCVGVLLDVLGVLWTTRVIDAAERR
jgi:Flp pilus assembly protein TadB